MANIPLTTDSDTLSGTVHGDVFAGPAGGTDTLSGLGGNDEFDIASGSAGTIDGGKGTDTVVATDFDLGTMAFSNVEHLDLGSGGISASAAQLSAFQKIFTGNGSDVQIQLTGVGGTIDFGSEWHGRAPLHIDGFGAGDGTGYVLTGTHRQDFMAGSDFADVISGGAGNDFISTRDGNGDILHGDDGNDNLSSFATNASLFGDDGKDVMFMYSGGLLNGGNGNNSMSSQLGTTFMGGLGADHMHAGIGPNQFDYAAVAESTSGQYDAIRQIDLSHDTFSVPVAVTGTDGAVAGGALSHATFDADLASAVGAAEMGVAHAVLFTPDSGDLAGHTFMIVDQNGVAGYQSAQDLVIEFLNARDLASFGTGNFA